MDFLKQWTICVCITLIVAIILSLLTPNSSMGRFYKMLISIFIFLSFVYPFAEFDFSSLNYDFETSYDELENSLNETTQIMIKNSVLTVLKDNNIIGSTVDIDTYVADDLVCVNKILITVPDEYNKQTVENIVFENLSLNAEVVHIGE